MKTVSVGMLVLFWLAPPNAVVAQESKTVLVHYMPWFGSKSVSGQWGWHWTMKNRDPEKFDGDKREIASHYYPLIGPYDSSDPDALEYHVLLMKFSGVDGVIIDWYGIDEHFDYLINHRNTERLIEVIKKAGLKFTICYEDQTVKHLVDAGLVKKNQDIQHGKKVIGWLAKNWFVDEAYVKLNGKPVLLVFGPQYYPQDQLKQIAASVSPEPLLFALPHLAKSSRADGVFGWPPVDGGKTVTPKNWSSYLSKLDESRKQNVPVIAPVFPQFHDYYKEGEGRPSFGSIAHRDGKTFDETLANAIKSNAGLIQVATWNDFGEGTMIEPTREFGYRFLESLQSAAPACRGEASGYTPDNLRLPLRLYNLRKKRKDARTTKTKLESVSDLLFAGKCNEANELLTELEELADKNSNQQK